MAVVALDGDATNVRGRDATAQSGNIALVLIAEEQAVKRRLNPERNQGRAVELLPGTVVDVDARTAQWIYKDEALPLIACTFGRHRRHERMRASLQVAQLLMRPHSAYWGANA